MSDITTVVRVITILLLIALITILLMRRISVPYTLGLVIVGLVISFFGAYFNVSFTLAPNLVLFILKRLPSVRAWPTDCGAIIRHIGTLNYCWKDGSTYDNGCRTE